MVDVLFHAGEHTIDFLTSWRLEPLQVIPTLVVALLYARRVRTLERAGTPVATWRIWSFGTGLFLVLVALVSPIDALGEEQFFFVHMIQHILLGDLAPLAFVAGLTGPILRPVLSLPGVWRLRFLTHPLVALPLWALNLYLWHIPFMYEAALHHSAVHALEHFSFFSFGAIMWARRARDASGSGVVRHRGEARIRRRREADRDGPRQHLHLGGDSLLSVLRAPGEHVGDLGALRPADRRRGR